MAWAGLLRRISRAARMAGSQIALIMGYRLSERPQHALLVFGFDLLAGNHIAAVRIDGFQGHDIMTAEVGNRSCQQGFEPLTLANLPPHLLRHAFIGRAIHIAKGLAHALV